MVNSVIIYSSSSSSKPVWISLFCRTQRNIFWRKFVTRLFWGTIDFHSREKKNTMEVNGAPELLCFPHSSEYLPLCSAEQRHSYRFGTTWGWVNDDRIYIFGWTIPLRLRLGSKLINYYVMAKLNFQQPLRQFSMSHYSSEIILICWFGEQETFLIIIIVEKSCAAF